VTYRQVAQMPDDGLWGLDPVDDRAASKDVRLSGLTTDLTTHPCEPKVACVVMQKDEKFLLRPWLAYYGWLFGFSNLHVIDNGSELPDVQATLAEFERFGVNVDRSHAGRKSYEAKGEVISAAIQKIQQRQHYNFIMPLDCDEFILLKEEMRYSVNREAILLYLLSLIDEVAVLRFPYQLANHPLTGDIYHHYHMPKIFFAGGTFGGVDHGHHKGRSLRSNDIRDTRLIHLHFHFKRFDEYILQARRSWIGHVSPDDTAGLRDYKGESLHLSSYFAKDRDTYYREFLNRPYFYIPEFRRLLNSLNAPLYLPDDAIPPECLIRLDRAPPARGFGSRGSVVFIPDRSSAAGGFIVEEFHEKQYLEANRDIVNADGGATSHFCNFGFREKRALR
jgi:Glycosyl transferase family 2